MSLTTRQQQDYGSFIVDGKGTVLGFDDGLERLTGWSAIDVVGQNKASLGDADDDENSAGLYNGDIAMIGNTSRLLLELNCLDGRSLGTEASVVHLAGPGDRVLVTVNRVLSQTADSSPIMDIANIDSLTGLWNCDAFARQLSVDAAAAIGAQQPMALILMDVDHLNEINEGQGRDIGDGVLRQVAEILRQSVGDASRIFRLGNDDFAILLPDSGRGEARQKAAAIRTTVARHNFFDGARGGDFLKVTVSLGAASLPTDAETPDDLMDRAHEALDEARAMGRNRVWCYLRRPRVPVTVPVFFDGAESLLVGYTRDLSPSGIFVQTSAPVDIGMRCAFRFALPGHGSKVHVIGRVVRTVRPEMSSESGENRVPGMGIEFERFNRSGDRAVIDTFLHGLEGTSLRPEDGRLSLG